MYFSQFSGLKQFNVLITLQPTIKMADVEGERRREVQNDDGRKGLKWDKMVLDWRVVVAATPAVGESSADKELQLWQSLASTACSIH